MEKLVIPPKHKGRRSKRPTDKILVALYEEYTTIEIGDMFRVPPATVRTWMFNLRKEQAAKEQALAE